MESRVPVSMPTSFLCSGKTTLLNARLLDASSGRIAAIVSEFGEVGLDLTGLSTKAHKPMAQLSGGERQSAHIARALAQERCLFFCYCSEQEGVIAVKSSFDTFWRLKWSRTCVCHNLGYPS